MKTTINNKTIYLVMCLGLIAIVVFGQAKGEFFNIRSAFGYGGGLPSAAFNAPSAPTGGFDISINDGDKETASRIVILSLNGGVDTENMAISNFNDFRWASLEPYLTTKIWILTEGEGVKTVYAKFYNQWGQASSVVDDTITFITPPPPPEILPAEEKADINRDGQINLLDFNLLMVDWGEATPESSADLNSDNIVDILDFNLLMVYWAE